MTIENRSEWIINTIELINEGREDGFFRTRNIICPWCGIEKNASITDEPSDAVSVYQCTCGKQFVVMPHISVEFTTKRHI